MRVVCSKEHRYKRKPNHYCRIHSEANEFRFIEILWNLSRLDRIYSTSCDQYHIVDEAEYKALAFNATFQYHFVTLSFWRVGTNTRRLKDKPYNCKENLLFISIVVGYWPRFRWPHCAVKLVDKRPDRTSYWLVVAFGTL